MEQSGADWNVNKTEQQYFGWRKWNKFKVTIPVMFILRVGYSASSIIEKDREKCGKH